MIFDPENIPCPADSEIVTHVTGEFKKVCAEAVVDNPEALYEVAKAVEHFLDTEAKCSFVESDKIVMLASQALSSVGEEKAARRMILYGSGLVRPSEWIVTGEDSMWVLDLKQITVREDAMLELFFYKSLYVVLDSISDIWDQTSGNGTLGLRHVCAAAKNLSGDESKSVRLSAVENEIIDVCRCRLEQMSADRNWTEVPGVVNLDV